MKPYLPLAFVLCAVAFMAPSVQAGGGSCTNSTTCVFSGFSNFALGNATLSVSGGSLIVSNITSSGFDGVQIEAAGYSGTALDERPGRDDLPGGETVDLAPNSSGGATPNTGHEEWIELGFVQWEPNVNPGNGSYVDFDAVAQIQNQGLKTVNLHIEEVAGLAQISTDFSTIGATTLEYRVFNGVAQNGGACLAQPVNSVVTSAVWPIAMAFSEVNWTGAVTINLPCGPRVGDRLEIEPVGAGNVDKAIRIISLVRTLPPSSAPESTEGAKGQTLHSPDLTSWSIAHEDFPLGSGSGPVSVPTLGTVAAILFLMLLAAGGVLVLLRRRPGIPGEKASV